MKTIRNKLAIVAAVMFLRAFFAQANDPGIPIAIYDFKTTERVLKQQAPKMTAIVTANLSSDPRLVVVERAQLNKALSEQALGLGGGVSAEAAAQVGHLTGAKILVSGQLFIHGFGENKQLLVVANIVGTETGRLYTEKFEAKYPPDLPSFANHLSGQIVTNLLNNVSNLVTNLESRDERIARIIKAAKGGKRPTVFVNITDGSSKRGTNSDIGVNIELGLILQKTGFTVLDEKSDQKADVELTGVSNCDFARKGGQLFICHATIAVKMQERGSGRIIAFERQESSAMDLGRQTSGKLARANAADELAARLIPLLSQ
jgi:hypothetical protein